MSAGARLTVMRLAGRARPEAISADRTRSRDSATALSPRPTMVKATVPEAICTWTSTGRASTPSKATVDTRATMSAPRPGSPMGQNVCRTSARAQAVKWAGPNRVWSELESSRRILANKRISYGSATVPNLSWLALGSKCLPLFAVPRQRGADSIPATDKKFNTLFLS